MTGVTGPMQWVRGQPAAPPRVGLIISARTVDESDDHWMNGFNFESEVCSPGTGMFFPCASQEKSFTAEHDRVEYLPGVVWAGDRCTTLQVNSRNYETLARNKLAQCESFLLARELWTGDGSEGSGHANPALAEEGSEILTANTGESALDALACLEDYLATCACGMRGMIHATRGVVTRWVADHAVYRQGNLLVTAMDTIVVPDAGYPGTAPEDVAAVVNVAWAIATLVVDVRLGRVKVVPDNIGEATDRDTNTVTYRAERFASAVFDPCCRAAAGIAQAACTIGS